MRYEDVVGGSSYWLMGFMVEVVSKKPGNIVVQVLSGPAWQQRKVRLPNARHLVRLRDWLPPNVDLKDLRNAYSDGQCDVDTRAWPDLPEFDEEKERAQDRRGLELASAATGLNEREVKILLSEFG